MRAATVSVFVLLAGCSSSTPVASTGDGGVDAPSSPLPCEVSAILERRCQSCHGATPTFGAPMPLVTHGDLTRPSPTEPSRKIYEVMKDRIHREVGEVGRMPQKPNAPLSSADRATLDRFVDGGAPSGAIGKTCGGSGADAGVISTLGCSPDVTVRPTSKFTMKKTDADLYVCYGFDQEVLAKRHITGIAPRIVNSKIVHHVLLMQSDKPYNDGTPTPCAESGVALMRMLYAWAPGVGSFELPEVAGLPAEPGKTHYVVQIHYNNLRGLEGETDDSGFELCSTEKLRANDADVLAFGTLKFEIPAKSKLDVTAAWKVPANIPEIHAIGSFPHMHQTGKSIATTLHRADGSDAVGLGAAPAFDFGSQFFLPLPGVSIKSGDSVQTRCVWENPRETPVKQGENTADEMCFNFTMYYPKIKVTPWSWALPSYLATTTVNPP